MFSSKECIENAFDVLLKKLEGEELFVSQPMSDYKLGKNWTDEMRIQNGHTKIADGSWVTIHKVSAWVEALKKGSTKLYEENQKAYRKIELLQKQKYEMEYGLRAAEKAMKNSLALAKEMINE